MGSWVKQSFPPSKKIQCAHCGEHNLTLHIYELWGYDSQVSRGQCLIPFVIVHFSVMSDSLRHHGLQHARLSQPSPSPRACSHSCPLSRWCQPTISSSIVPFSSYLQSFPASGSFSVSCLFASGGQSIGVSALTSVLPVNILDWFPLGLNGLISLLSQEPSRVIFSTTVQKHQFFSAQPSLWSSSHIHTWPLEKP